MRIAHIVSTFPPYIGGIGNFCFYQVQELAKFGYDITVFTPQYKKTKFQIPNLKFQIKYLRSILKYGNAAWIPQIVKHLKNFDVIHLHWPFIGGTEIVLFWKLLNKNKSLINADQDVDKRSCISANSRKSAFLVVQYQMDLVGKGWLGCFFNFYQWLFIPLMVKVADKIIVSSFDYVKNCRLKKYFQKFPNKFIEIPLAVDTEKFFPGEKDQSLLKKYNLKSDDKIVLFVGSLDRAHYFKGLDVLLNSFQRLLSIQYPESSLKLMVVGEGNLRPKYENLAKDLGMGERVIFAGQVSDEDLPKYYNLADIFVLPSIDKSEAFGLVLLEAMACAKSIIVSDLPGPRTLVRENINGLLFKIGDSNDLAQKIKFLLENQEIIKKWGAVGRQIVEQNYSWSVICQKLDQAYKKL